MTDPDGNKGNDSRRDSGVLNDTPDLGSVGKARSSGGAGAAAFIRPGMPVIGGDGAVLGTVEKVVGDRIYIAGEPEGDFVPLGLVDGVDDARVILSSRGDASFGLGATP